MRIITGKLKGRNFNIPKGLDVRPTTDRTKESIFNLIEARVFMEGTQILDLFAGSGNLGFEAISRGARHVTSVELDPQNVKQIEKTAAEFGIDDQMRIVCSDAQRFLNGMAIPYHFIFCDPPYDYPFMDELIDQVFEENWLTDEGWFILEHDKYKDFTDHPKCTFSKAYGRTIVSIFQKHPVDSE
ncbi:MAG: 16S rRNA (guanine(966)-N(2))-methyltransferase RsmD [Gracilimonas sp.]|uniref:16S rRNA (guanine(966)-N(2))-methyltransferase RsmD n=1 Tax=Gracilimonas TaxID=649462 RepID=UPI001B2D32F9|nr:16S rRNA (guanine(966)-N(2))-methyltransferase RsmD [Gracilimonas sp.]MBO6584607.1 16S rRNA (guanine(966)-N(2))-methyltransferase RsmD [Gracilimonas sp.]MBO6616122.1 16S rRNA (guanine(966)-N(2))-methyltransferase RsmD [Gracilimonas sp.]